MKHYNIIFLIILFTSCNKEFNTIGDNLIDREFFKTSLEEVPVYVKMKKIPPFVANNVSNYQLGVLEDNIFGKSEAIFFGQINLETSNPAFGVFRQSDETNGDENNVAVIDEKETISEVFLDIPFFTNVDDSDGDGVINLYDVDSTDPESDSDGDGLSDLYETQNGLNPLSNDTDGDGILDDEDLDSVNPNVGEIIYQLDSLLGNSNAKFKLKISELDYYLSILDPNTNLEDSKKYFSNNEIPLNYSGKVLFDEEVSINSKELVFYEKDDPATTDVDESETVKERLSPRIRVSLDKDFFQQKILDKEGTQDLYDNEKFKVFFKGLVIKAYDFSDPLLMILNFDQSEIRINYDYQKYDKKDTENDTSDDEIIEENSTYYLRMGGIKANSFKNDPYPVTVSSEINDTINNPKLIYIKGGAGVMAEIELFKNNDGLDILQEIKSKEWLINEASLSIYIDKNMLSSSGGIIEPSRLYLFNIKSKTPLLDYFIDETSGPKKIQNKIVHGGIIKLDEDEKGLMYKIKLSEHVKNIVRKDSTNVKLGLVVSSDITNSLNINTKSFNSGTVKYTPLSSAINPLGTVLIGPSPSAENYDKRMKLNLYYTEVNKD